MHRTLFKTIAILASAIILSACQTPYRTGSILAQDDFLHGLDQWKIEQQNQSGTVKAENGILDIVQSAGATIWLKQKLAGNYEIQFTATAIPFSSGNFSNRISDLNLFWNAQFNGNDPDPTHQAFDGALNSYNPLQLYYAGFGANNNKTTRLRKYDGSAERPQLFGYADQSEATPADQLGETTPATRLAAHTPVKVRVVSRAATADDPVTLKWYANDVLIFSYADPKPYLEGWFAFRTTVSHLQIRDFQVLKL